MNHSRRSRSTVFVLAIIATYATAFAPNTHAQKRNREPMIETERVREIDANVDAKASIQAPAQNGQVVITSDEIESLLDNLAAGLPKVVKTRVFSWGQLVNSSGQEFNTQPLTGVFDPTTRELVVQSTFAGSRIVEDYRFLELSDRFIVIRDVYFDGPTADLSLGRETPVMLDDEPSVSASKLSSKSVQATALAAPTISSIGGETSDSAGIKNGVVSMTCGTKWNGYRVVNDQTGTYRWYIYGSNFGSTAGSVQLAGRTAQIYQWSSTQITFFPTVPYNSGPVCALLTIYTSNGTISYAVNIVPSIRSRIYGQCTWYVALARLNMGKQPSPYAYSGYTQITASWWPQRGDQLQWGGKHTAIISSVSGPTYQSGGYATWTLAVEEYNNLCTNAFNSYTTTFQMRTASGVTSVTRYPQSSVSSFGSATLYYR